MRVWLASFFVLFGMAEFYQWVKHFTVPLPVYILGGAFLAIASNYDRRAGFPFQRSNEQPLAMKNATSVTPVILSTNSPNNPLLNQIPSIPESQISRPISFIINRSDDGSEREEIK